MWLKIMQIIIDKGLRVGLIAYKTKLNIINISVIKVYSIQNSFYNLNEDTFSLHLYLNCTILPRKSSDNLEI